MRKGVGTRHVRTRRLSTMGAGWLVLAVVMLLCACNESEYAKQRRVEKVAYDARVEARYKERIKELPPTAAHPRGLVELKLNARLYRIPREYFYSRDDVKLGSTLMARWPDLSPLPDPIEEHAQHNDVVKVRMSAHDWEYHYATDDELEKAVVYAGGEPIRLDKHPELQEYPALSGRTNPRYRPIDKSIRRTDGLRAYFECIAQPISQGFEIEQSPPYWYCRFDLAWPDSVLMNLDFSRSNFKDWKLIHDRVTAWFESFRVLDVPTERLYPSYKDGTIIVPPVERRAFRLE